jgi:hypothetical protein
MITITCGCGRLWATRAKLSDRNLVRDLLDEHCPDCGPGAESGVRVLETHPEPDIRDVLASLAAWGEQPVRLLSVTVVPHGRDGRAMPFVVVECDCELGITEFIAEVDPSAQVITRVWYSNTKPVRTACRRMASWLTLRGTVQDVMLSAGLGVQAVPNWQAWITDVCPPLRSVR